MIAYLDTSALLKLYLQESGSAYVHAMAAGAVACTHLIARVEVHAGLAMAVRMGRLSGADLDGHLRCFESDWSAMNVVNVDEPLARRAGTLARRFGLRAYDSVHLAAAERVALAVESREFVFLCFDERLNAAAEGLGMPLPKSGV